jgi:hypothetical protein
MTLLEDLWYGNINPHETILKGNKQFKNLLSLMGRNRNKLNDTLANQQKELLEKYDDVINEMHSLAEVESFTCGFSLGIRLMMESVLVEFTAGE